MKKRRLLSMLACVTTAVTILSTTAVAAAEQDLGVVVISGDEEEGSSEPVSLDDIKIGEEVEIPDYAIFTPTECAVLDEFKKKKPSGWETQRSGNTAEYVILYLSLINQKTKAVDFNADISSVVVTYNEKYQYAGWNFQRDADSGEPKGAISSDSQFSIDPMYEGLYMVGCTLPNAVIEGTEPLALTFKLGENDITYNIRK